MPRDIVDALVEWSGQAQLHFFGEHGKKFSANRDAIAAAVRELIGAYQDDNGTAESGKRIRAAEARCAELLK